MPTVRALLHQRERRVLGLRDGGRHRTLGGGIHDLKPDHCRKYPKSRRHADEIGCPGYG
jgi:hypothetical protein